MKLFLLFIFLFSLIGFGISQATTKNSVDKSENRHSEAIDSSFRISIKLLQKTAYIDTSSTPTILSVCKLHLTLVNNGDKEYTETHPLSINLQSQESNFFLEAINEDGSEIKFPENAPTDSYLDNSKFTIKPGAFFSKEFYINYIFHFPISGAYKVRLVFRPTQSSSGLNKMYYSNWETLIVKHK